MTGSIYRLAERVLDYRSYPKFDRSPDGLRAEAAWMEHRDEAWAALEAAVRPQREAVRDRMWRRYDNGGFRKNTKERDSAKQG